MAKAEKGLLEKATFAAGCFWGVEEIFRTMKGVKGTKVGYTGGSMGNPTYEDVCSDETGHAEALQIEFNPLEISYEELVRTFFNNHNPTTLNRQGPDIGDQYKSIIFYHNDRQKKAAEKSKQALEKSGKFSRKIVTEIEPALTFYKAEDYHQKYLMKRGLKTCRI